MNGLPTNATGMYISNSIGTHEQSLAFRIVVRCVRQERECEFEGRRNSAFERFDEDETNHFRVAMGHLIYR